MSLRVISVIDGIFEVPVKSNEITCKQIKKLIYDQKKYNPSLQQLVLNGKKLKDEDICNIKGNDLFVTMLMKLSKRNDRYLNEREHVELTKTRNESLKKQKIKMSKEVNPAIAARERLRVQQQQEQQQQQYLKQFKIPKLSEIPVGDEHIAMIMSMGFSPLRAKKALVLNGLDVNRSVDWLIMNSGSYILDSELTMDEVRRSAVTLAFLMPDLFKNQQASQQSSSIPASSSSSTNQ